MITVSLDKAKEILPDLVDRVLAGEEVEIVVDSRKVRLAAIDTASSYRGRGLFKGQLIVGDEFFDPLPEDELERWEGRNDK